MKAMLLLIKKYTITYKLEIKISIILNIRSIGFT